MCLPLEYQPSKKDNGWIMKPLENDVCNWGCDSRVYGLHDWVADDYFSRAPLVAGTETHSIFFNKSEVLLERSGEQEPDLEISGSEGLCLSPPYFSLHILFVVLVQPRSISSFLGLTTPRCSRIINILKLQAKCYICICPFVHFSRERVHCLHNFLRVI